MPDNLRAMGFAAAVCLVCATVVSTAASVLAERQREAADVDKHRQVLVAAGLADPDERMRGAEVQRRFAAIEAVEVDVELPPHTVTVYEVRDAHGRLDRVVLPVQGPGLWSTLRGLLCLRADLHTVCGLTFYSHGETPGLGAELDNPRWQARWVGRRVFDADGRVAITVAKGPVGPPATDPHRVDAISGATITSDGVTELLQVWLGERGFAPWLSRRGQEGPR